MHIFSSPLRKYSIHEIVLELNTTMSASQVNNLKDLSTDEEYYQRVYDVFETVCDRREKMYEWICNDLPAVVDSIETDPGRALNVLSVGAGNGMLHHMVTQPYVLVSYVSTSLSPRWFRHVPTPLVYVPGAGHLAD